MILNRYFTLNSGLRVGVKYMAHCLLTDLLLLHSADKGQHESRAVAGKPYGAVAKFDIYRN